jgi:drug/metabolite transporter (DMT)-like permease
MVVGGCVLGARSAHGGAGSLLGVLAVTGASLGWALDNTLTRPLADLDPRAVVFGKSLLGAGLSFAIAWALHDAWPAVVNAAGLMACGAAGYGLSLRAYLHAQRILGAGRTGSLFALAPFVGAAIAVALGEREGAALVAAASGLFAVAAYLHITERHAHRHVHERIRHEHAHRHEDGHHTHVHDPPFAGTHSHLHEHDLLEHEHPHLADIHHRHRHAGRRN